MTAGYSGTPLAKKLGIKAGHRVALINPPDGLRDLLAPLPEGVVFDDDLGEPPDVVLAFFVKRDELDDRLPELEAAVFPDKALWACWPKKASKVPTDLSGNVVRSTILQTHLVDVKVCAVSAVFTGLKCVWRKEHRKR